MPPAPPQWTPQSPPFTGPPSPKQSHGALVAAVAGAVIVLVLLIGYGIVWLNRLPQREAIPPQSLPPSSPSSAVTSAPQEQTYSQVQDPCSLGAALPPDAGEPSPNNGDNGDPSFQICHWQHFGTDAATDLEVEVQFYRADQDGGSATDRTHQQFVEDQQKSIDPPYLTHVDPLPGVGAEGWIGALISNTVAGPDDTHTHSYWTGGVESEVRVRNAVITVDWTAATYPSGAGSQSVLRGTNLPYDQSSQQAIAIIQAMIAKLS